MTKHYWRLKFSPFKPLALYSNVLRNLSLLYRAFFFGITLASQYSANVAKMLNKLNAMKYAALTQGLKVPAAKPP